MKYRDGAYHASAFGKKQEFEVGISPCSDSYDTKQQVLFFLVIEFNFALQNDFRNQWAKFSVRKYPIKSV